MRGSAQLKQVFEASQHILPEVRGFWNRLDGRVTAFILLAWVVAVASMTSGTAAPVQVPNASFESPTTTFADPRIDYWQKAPKPAWYDESGGFLWDQLAGVFLNTAPGTTNHIDNIDGNQAVFLFAVPQVELFQDAQSPAPTNGAPGEVFDARFEVGNSYRLTFGLIGGGGMAEGVSLQAALYYRTSPTNIIQVAATNIVYSPARFTSTSHFDEFSLEVPTVQTGDPWANQPLGVQFLSTVAPNLAGGYWDIDNVRLTRRGDSEVSLAGISHANGTVTLTLESAPEATLSIVTAGDLRLPSAQWTQLGLVTNTTGTVTFRDTSTNAPQRFYRARLAQ